MEEVTMKASRKDILQLMHHFLIWNWEQQKPYYKVHLGVSVQTLYTLLLKKSLKFDHTDESSCVSLLNNCFFLHCTKNDGNHFLSQTFPIIFSFHVSITYHVCCCFTHLVSTNLCCLTVFSSSAWFHNIHHLVLLSLEWPQFPNTFI